jgi:hypothetical protein
MRRLVYVTEGDMMQGVRTACRFLVSTVVVAAMLVATAGPAAAHRCTSPAQIPVGKSTTVSVGVTIEASSPKHVSVLIPAGMQVDQIFPATGGWTGRLFPPTAPKEVLYERGSFDPYSCVYFPIRVSVKARGVYVLSVDQLLPDGTEVRYPTSDEFFVINGKTENPQPGAPPNPLFEQVVYAGVPVGTVPNGANGGTTAGGGNGWLFPVIAVIAVGGAGLVGWWAPVFIARRRHTRTLHY